MIHFVTTYSSFASDSPFARELTALCVEHRIFAERVVMRYHRRWWLLFVGWPKLFLFAIRTAWQSLFRSTPRPDCVVIASHIEAWVFAVMRRARRRSQTRLVFVGFILTERSSAIKNRLRRLFFRALFSRIDQVICYSELEARRYAELFRGTRASFSSMPYGLHISRQEHVAPERSTYAFSAGRSGRDYPTLVAAFEGAPIALHVACDSLEAFPDRALPSNIVVLRKCYDVAYVRELWNARIVVLTLTASDISAGQMVLLQAMAFGKPIVITRTPTIEEYVSDGVNALLVPRNDVEALVSAIALIVSNGELAERLGRNALRTYEERHSMTAYVRHLVSAVQGEPRSKSDANPSSKPEVSLENEAC